MSDTTAADQAEAEAWVEATITAHCACATYVAGVKAYLAGLAAGDKRATERAAAMLPAHNELCKVSRLVNASGQFRNIDEFHRIQNWLKAAIKDAAIRNTQEQPCE